MSKKSLFTTLIFLITAHVFAQSPDKMSYQAVIRNSSNKLVTNTAVGMKISILQTTATGTAVYVETQKPTTNINGLVSIEIGSGTVVSGTFASIDWSKGPYFIKTETDPNGGTSYTITGTSQLLSVPFALYAKKAGNGFTGNYNDLTNKPTIPTKVSELTNDKGYISKYTEKDSSVTNEIQSLKIKDDTIFLSKAKKDSNYVVLPKAQINYTNSYSSNSLYFESSGVSFATAKDSFVSKYSGRYPTYATINYQIYSFLIPRDGVLKNLLIAPMSAALNSDSKVSVTILVNGKPTSLLIDFDKSDGFNFKVNSTNLLNVKKGDYVAIEYKSKGKATPNSDFQATVELASLPKANEFAHYIGELYGGGIIVSVWKDTSGAEHGLVASLKDLSTGMAWSNVATTAIGATAQSWIDGQANTNAILSQAGHTSSAAQICDTFTGGGFKDWYLPAYQELIQLNNEIFILNNILGSNNGFQLGTNYNYWSSTEKDTNWAITIYFGTFSNATSNKSNNATRVRAVRKY